MIKLLKKFRIAKAQTMVEFALVFPIVLLITYGLMEFGRMFFIYISVTSAAREGARYAVGASFGAEQYDDCATIRKVVDDAAFLITVPSGNVSITYLDNNGNILPYTCDTLDPTSIKLGYQVQIRISGLKFEPLIGSFLGIQSFTIPDRVNTRTVLKDIVIDQP